MKVRIIILVCLLAAAVSARAEVTSGTYVGNGAGPRQISGVGFRPEVVIVKGDLTDPAVIRTATLPAGRSKLLAGDHPLEPNRIRDLTADGFEIGSDKDVNSSGVVYAWVAFSSSPGELKLGTYTGNGSVLQNVNGVGFQPELVFVLPGHGSRPCWRSSVMPASQSMPFDRSLRTGLISGFAADGFQVGWDNDVNQFGVVYHYVAWNMTPGSLAVGTYAGDGGSSQDITGLAFKPEWVLVKIGDNDLPAVQKPRALGGQDSGFVTPEVFTTEGIQDVHGFGFRVGADNAVNNDGHAYYYAAFDDNPGDDADLAVTIAADLDAPIVGQDVVYTITLRNDGPDAATTVAASIVLPIELTYTSHVAGLGTYNSVSGIWTVGNLNAGASSVLTVTARLDAGVAGQVLTTTADISAGDQSDPNPANNTAAATVTVASPDADLAVGLAVDDDTPDELQPLVCSVTVTNHGPRDATGVRLQLASPAGVQLDQMAWDVGSLTAGASDTLDVPAQVLAGTAGQALAVTAAIAASGEPDPVPANDTATVEVLVASSDLVLALAASDPTPDEGQLVTLTVTLTNAGPDPNANILVSLAWPAGLMVQGHTADAGTYDDAAAAWSLADLVAGATVTLQVQAVVGAGTGGTSLTTSATIDAADRGDPVVANNAAIATVLVTSADLAISLTADDATPNQGDPVTFTVTLVNHGPDDASGIAVATVLPAELAFVSSTPAIGSYDDATGVWTIADLSVAATTTLQILTTVDALGGMNLITSATVTSADQSDPVTANNSSGIAIGVLSADLALALSVSDTVPDEDQLLVYTLILTNLGPDGASGVTIAAALPTGVTHTASSPDLGTYDHEGGAWNVGGLAAGASATLTISGTVDVGTGGSTLPMLASVTAADQADVDPANNTAQQTVTVTSVDLGLAATASDDTPDEGQSVILVLTLENYGPNDASGIVAAVDVPAGLDFVGSDGSFDDATGAWTVGSLAAGASAELQITVTVGDGTGGTTLNTSAAVSAADQSDPVTANNAVV
ncbi:MAG: hypothetical protein Q7W56_00585, partial [Candidatus Latescibacteria bacterium]|nr:hypothetical protein [Candidatus Latescibacterota bacterium]